MVVVFDGKVTCLGLQVLMVGSEKGISSNFRHMELETHTDQDPTLIPKP